MHLYQYCFAWMVDIYKKRIVRAHKEGIEKRLVLRSNSCTQPVVIMISKYTVWIFCITYNGAPSSSLILSGIGIAQSAWTLNLLAYPYTMLSWYKQSWSYKIVTYTVKRISFVGSIVSCDFLVAILAVFFVTVYTIPAGSADRTYTNAIPYFKVFDTSTNGCNFTNTLVSRNKWIIGAFPALQTEIL